MEVWTALIAVLGTLAGSIVSGHAARRAADRQERAARAERARTEKMHAYLAFAEALTDLRRTGQNQAGEPVGEDHRQPQAAAQHALLRVRLLTPSDTDTVDAAQAALHATTEIGHATDPARREQVSAWAIDAADAFLARAATVLS
jgi:hypothetical protein